MTKCFSVAVKDCQRISANCFRVVTYDGSEALVPVSQVYGTDPLKPGNMLLTSWILERKNLQYSSKTPIWVDEHSGNVVKRGQLHSTVHHKPPVLQPVKIEADADLIRKSNEGS